MNRAEASTPGVVAIITARGGSKGIPGKNLRPLGGRPMIAWTIEAAQQAKRLTRVLVSTDDPDIARVARECGAEVPFLRPAELALDNSPHIEVILHALDWLQANGGEPAYACLLQPTAPLRIAADIDGAIALAIERQADAVIGLGPLEHHPYLARSLAPDGTMGEFVPCDLKYPRRQDFPPAYRINGAVYVNRTAALRRDRTFFPPGALGYVMPPERSIDVDNRLDLVVVEHLLEQRNATI
jgi:CMP-N,N'-diacetyllegionaminic acid synthase